MLAGLLAGLQAGLLALPALPWEAEQEGAGAHQLTRGAYAANQKGALLAYKPGLSRQTLSASHSAKALCPVSELQIDSVCFTVLSRECAAAG